MVGYRHEMRVPNLNRTKLFLATYLLLGLFALPLDSSGAPKAGSATITVEPINIPIHVDTEIWNRRDELLRGAISSLTYLATDEADVAYRKMANPGITRDRALRSLARFAELLGTSRSFEAFQTTLRREFTTYRAVGTDGHGTVKFTGYFRPVYYASRKRTPEYQFPIFRKPGDFTNWLSPHPTRVQLEGFDGKGSESSPLRGYELAFLRSRWDAFMIHLQGSAVLELTDGKKAVVGFAAGTDHRFVGIKKNFLAENNVSWKALPEFFAERPDLLNNYLSRNNRFIFFDEQKSSEPIGSLGFPVIAGRSIATDKLRTPPGALGVIETLLPFKTADSHFILKRSARLVLDHDTGSAIKGPGRVDIFMGTGEEARRQASSLFAEGQLYYLMLKDDPNVVPQVLSVRRLSNKRWSLL